MWLVNIYTKRLEAFNDDNTKKPDYAILSHTWGPDDEELSFQDLQSSETKTGSGREKFEACCAQAKKNQLAYAWIDTCCINKTSSAELSEGCVFDPELPIIGSVPINSMFKWYRDAKICYAYLSDVHSQVDPVDSESDFGQSRWFQRGWTLQELIAPRTIHFYNAQWTYLGDKATLSTIIERTTLVPRSLLLGHIKLRELSIAQRMSWAAKRITKRREDIAYCLLGIFDVNMPMLYGEGDKAFKRLQETILLSQPNDDSILAWSCGRGLHSRDTYLDGALASNPSDFLGCDHVVCTSSAGVDDADPLALLALQGRSIFLRRPLIINLSDQHHIVLRCRFGDQPAASIAVPVQPRSGGFNNFTRTAKDPVISINNHLTAGQNKDVRISINHSFDTYKYRRQDGFYLENFMDSEIKLVEVFPSSCWDWENSMLLPNEESQIGRFDRIWAMFRPRDASPNIVLLLDRMWRGSVPYVRHHVVSCNPNVSLRWIQQDLHLASDEESLQHVVDQADSVGNGSVHCHVTVSRNRVGLQDMFYIKIRPSQKPASFYNCTADLEKFAQQRRVGVNLQEKYPALRQFQFQDGNYDIETFRERLAIIEILWESLNQVFADAQRDRSKELKEEIDKLSEAMARIIGRGNNVEREVVVSQGDLEDTSLGTQTPHVYNPDRGQSKQLKEEINKLSETVARIIGRGINVEREVVVSQGDLEDTSLGTKTPHVYIPDQFNLELEAYMALADVAIMAKMAKGTLITQAAGQGKKQAVRILCCSGALTIQEDGVSPALIAASVEGHVAIVKMLLHHEFNATRFLVSNKDTSRFLNEALLPAISSGRTEVVQTLLEFGAPTDPGGSVNGVTPLMTAVRKDQREILHLLLDAGASIEATDAGGATALIYAARLPEPYCLLQLLERGAKATARNRRGKTAMSYAKSSGHSKNVRILEKWEQKEIKQSQDRNRSSTRANIRRFLSSKEE
ncbi:hypothetical protein F5Y18DRAFT_427426 [Xylariaceae sp. FL1019]|nr:hypothetical protein F5Y18DRAFT_427426 [Xylariaceae sp. FL1019]